MASSASNGLSYRTSRGPSFCDTYWNAQGRKNNGVSLHGCWMKKRDALCCSVFQTHRCSCKHLKACVWVCVCVPTQMSFCSPLLSSSEMPLITETYCVIKKQTHQNRACLQSCEKCSLGTYWLLCCSGSCAGKNRGREGWQESLVSRIKMKIKNGFIIGVHSSAAAHMLQQPTLNFCRCQNTVNIAQYS